MFDLVGINSLALTALVLSESVVLKTLVRETIWMKRLFVTETDSENHIVKTLGTKLPRFTANYLGENGQLSNRGLRGKSSILLIIAPSTRFSTNGFSTAIRMLLSKVDGNIFVFCSGTENQCKDFVELHPVHSNFKRRVHFLSDPEAFLSTHFRCGTAPCAIIIDEAGIVSKIGTQLSGTDEV